MTVAIGVICSDGVVLGSDSSSTLHAGDFPTIEQKTDKVSVIEPDVIVAGSGAVGLGQRFHCIVESIRNSNDFYQADPQAISKKLSAATIEDFRATYLSPGQYGALVSFPSAEGKHLCEFGIKDLQPEFKRPPGWFVSIGSGQPITDPFLALLKRVFFRETQPKLSEGVFAVTWALDHAIRLNTGGINGPEQIAQLETDGSGNGYSARLVDQDELDEHKNSVAAAEAQLAKYRDVLSGSDGEAPEIPKFNE